MGIHLFHILNDILCRNVTIWVKKEMLKITLEMERQFFKLHCGIQVCHAVCSCLYTADYGKCNMAYVYSVLHIENLFSVHLKTTYCFNLSHEKWKSGWTEGIMGYSVLYYTAHYVKCIYIPHYIEKPFFAFFIALLYIFTSWMQFKEYFL